MLIREHDFLMVEVGVGGEVVGIVGCFSFFVLGVKCGDCIIVIVVVVVVFCGGSPQRMDDGQEAERLDDDGEAAAAAWDDERFSYLHCESILSIERQRCNE